MLRRVMSGLAWIAALLLPAGRACADTWTNAAGNTFDAVPVELNGQTVIFERAGGEKVSMRLFSLAEDEQKRVSAVFNGPAIPPALQQAYRFAVDQLERARASFQEGQIDDATYASRRENVIRSFKKICADRGFPEDSQDVKELVLRLMDR
jgi:hypothetical protein